MIFANKENITLLNPEHVVNADQAARPDLIALKYYGNQSKLDMILKWNSISDPFSINEGDVLEIPHANAPFYKLERPKEFDATNNPVKLQFISGKRLSKKDQRRLDALKKKYGKDNLLPPNVIPVGKKNYEYVGSQIRMGAQAQTDAVVDAINRNLSIALGGMMLGDVKQRAGHEPINIMIQVPLAERSQISRLGDLPIHAPDGLILPLSELGEFQFFAYLTHRYGIGQNF